MKTITTALTTEAIFSDDNRKRYLLTKNWYFSDLRISELVEEAKKTITIPSKKEQS